MRRATPLLVTAVTLVGAMCPTIARACSCAPASLTRSYFTSSDTIAVKILEERLEGAYRYYTARVLKPFSGCTERGQVVAIETPASSATCGVTLREGERYLLTASADDSRDDPSTLRVGLCGYNRPITDLGDAERDFLIERQVVCGEAVTCADSTEPVDCPVDPCASREACTDATLCAVNVCGGCRSELYDADFAQVCVGDRP